MRPSDDISSYMPLSEADRHWIAVGRRFAEEVIRPRAQDWHERPVPGMPADVVRAWVDAGLINALVPQSRGGGGATYLAKIGIVEALSRVCMPSAFSLCNLQNGPSRILRSGTDDHVTRYLADMMAGRKLLCPCLTEPQSGSDFASMRTLARKVDGGWRITGEKRWITNAAIAHLGLVFAQTDPAKRGRGIGAFLVDLRGPGATVLAPDALVTGSVMGVAGIRLEDVFVADRDVFHGPGEGFTKALGSINSARTYVAAMCCGMVGAALEAVLAYGRTRVTFGQPIVEHQGMRWSIADIATDLEAARLLTYRAAQLIAEDKDAILAAAIAKKHAVEMADRCLPACLQMMGAEGLRAEHPFARHMLAARVAGFVDGSTEIQNDRIGSMLAKG